MCGGGCAGARTHTLLTTNDHGSIPSARTSSTDDDPSETTEEALKVQEYARKRWRELFSNLTRT
jgi:hypothetical protein